VRRLGGDSTGDILLGLLETATCIVQCSGPIKQTVRQ